MTTSARVQLLLRFGAVPDWLVERLEEFDHAQWRMFWDQVEATERIPKTFRDTMPVSEDGMICAPASEPDRYRAASQARWDQWSLIWGDPPWIRVQKSVKPRLPPKFKD